jgi:hypothetical protein
LNVTEEDPQEVELMPLVENPVAGKTTFKWGSKHDMGGQINGDKFIFTAGPMVPNKQYEFEIDLLVDGTSMGTKDFIVNVNKS